MSSAFYVALSGQVALDNRMQSLARNVANIQTAGYRADAISFDVALSETAKDPVSFATSGATYISRAHGGLEKTDNPLDLAIEGEGWFAIRRGNGAVYTRDGRLTMDAEGVLRTLGGEELLDTAGAPIILDPDAGPPRVMSDGEIHQGDQIVGVVGLFEIDPAANLTRQGGSAVVPDIPARPILDYLGTGISQGFIEGSNVNPMREMTKLIIVSRAFESAAKAVETSEGAETQAIRELGEIS